MKNKKLIIIVFFLIFFVLNIYSQSISGLVEVIDPSFIGKKLSSGTIYNPDENSCITSKYPMLTVLLLENLINGKKTIVYVIDTNPSFKFKDSIVAISVRAAKELGETGNNQIAVKITVLKEGTGIQSSQKEQTQVTSEDKQTINQPQDGQEKQVKEQETKKNEQFQIPIYTIGKQTSYTYYYVQVGAFKNRDNALAIAEKLKSLGYRVIIYFNKDLYKVLVGPYNNKEEVIEVKKIISSIFPKDQHFVFVTNLLFE